MERAYMWSLRLSMRYRWAVLLLSVGDDRDELVALRPGEAGLHSDERR